MVDEYTPLTLAHRALTRTQIELYGATFDLSPLNQAELDIFNAQFPTLLAAPSSVTRAIQLQRVEVYICAIRAIKKALNAPTFRGLNPEDTELGMQPIRPQFTKLANVYRTNWQQALVANTWTNFLSAAATTGYAVGEDFGMVLTHLTSLVTPSPFISELQMKLGRADLIPIEVRDIVVGDNVNQVAVYPIPTAILTPKETFYMQVKGDTAGTEELRLGGLVVGLGRVLKETAPTWT